MCITSSLVALLPTMPNDNFSSLIKGSFRLIYDPKIGKNIHVLLKKSHFELPESQIVYSKAIYEEFKLPSIIAACDLFEKAVRHADLSEREVPAHLNALESILPNMTCFALSKALGAFYETYTFIDPLQYSMKRFTQTLNEIGMYSLFTSIEFNFYVLYYQAERRELQNGEANKVLKCNEEKFVSFKAAKWLFAFYFSWLIFMMLVMCLSKFGNLTCQFFSNLVYSVLLYKLTKI